MVDRHQRGSSLLELLFALGISGILLMGVTSFVTKQLKLHRQLVDRSDLDTARRILRQNFSCENSLQVAAGSKISKCEGAYDEILNRRGVPLFAKNGRFGSSNIFVKPGCEEELGIVFDYRINDEPYQDMFPGELFCTEYFNNDPLAPEKCTATSPTEAPTCTFSNPINPNIACIISKRPDGTLQETCSN